jgi:hypothetical protein
MKIPNYTPSCVAGSLFCIKRHKSVKATPEERIRQRIIHYLKKKGWDLNNIKLETSIHYVTGGKGRADIILSSAKGNPSIVIECKKAGYPLGLDAIRQARKYANKIGCREILITNGNDHRLFEKRNRERVPKARSSILREDVPVSPVPKLPKGSHDSKLDDFMKRLPGLKNIDRQQCKLMRNLCTLIFSSQNWCSKPKLVGELFLLQDLGVEYLTISTPGGGYGGYYRLFRVANESRVETMGIGLQDYDQNKAQICVCVVKPKRTGHDLQLRIKGNVSLCNDGSVAIRHSGKMTKVPRDKVFDAVREANREDMIGSEQYRQIVLGVLPRPGKITKVSAEKFIANLLHYTLLRTALKDSIAAKTKLP